MKLLPPSLVSSLRQPQSEGKRNARGAQTGARTTTISYSAPFIIFSAGTIIGVRAREQSIEQMRARISAAAFHAGIYYSAREQRAAAAEISPIIKPPTAPAPFYSSACAAEAAGGISILGIARAGMSFFFSLKSALHGFRVQVL